MARRCSRTRFESATASTGAAYLESTNARNLPLYQRFGFEVTRMIRVGASPAVWPMIRRAR